MGWRKIDFIQAWTEFRVIFISWRAFNLLDYHKHLRVHLFFRCTTCTRAASFASAFCFSAARNLNEKLTLFTENYAQNYLFIRALRTFKLLEVKWLKWKTGQRSTCSREFFEFDNKSLFRCRFWKNCTSKWTCPCKAGHPKCASPTCPFDHFCRNSATELFFFSNCCCLKREIFSSATRTELAAQFWVSSLSSRIWSKRGFTMLALIGLLPLRTEMTILPRGGAQSQTWPKSTTTKFLRSLSAQHPVKHNIQTNSPISIRC